MKSKRLLLFALVLALGGCDEMHSLAADALSRPASDDERQVIQAVLGHEASIPRDGSPVCLAMRTEGIAFDSEREQERALREARPATTPTVESSGNTMAGNGLRTFDWRQVVPAQSETFEHAPRVEGNQAHRLDGAATAIINGVARSGQPFEIDAGLVPQQLRNRGSSLHCSTLTLTAPAFSNEIAFVETGYVCSGLCGNGWLYALERSEGRWRLVAVALTWVS